MESPTHRKFKDQPANEHMRRSLIKELSQSIFKRPLRDYVWVLVFALWIAAFILGYVGLSKVAYSQGQSPTPLDLVYLDLQLVMLESGSVPEPVPWELEIARFALPALAAYTAIQALAILFREQTQILRLWFTRNHVVICGLSRKGFLLAKNLLAQGQKVVLIEIDENNDLIDQLRMRGAIILMGDATDPAVLQRASVVRADYLIAVCEDDGINAEIAVQAQNLITNLDRDPLTCIIHVVDPGLCDLLREAEIGGNTFPGLRLELFNVFEWGAQQLLQEYPPFELDGPERDQAPHILLIGMGKMGENLVTRVAHAWHLSHGDSRNHLRLTMVDLNAEEKLKSLEIRYPHLMACCQFSALSMDVNSSDFHKADFLKKNESQGISIVYICFDNDSLGLNTGLSFIRLTKLQAIPIVVRMIEERGLALLLRAGMEDFGVFSNLHAFSLLDQTCTPELLFGGIHEMLARSVHEDYVRHQRSIGRPTEGNVSLVSWDQLPEEIKDSNRRYADDICIKLKAVDCYLAPLRDWDALEFVFSEPEVERMAKMEHERWVRERKYEGWTYAEERNEDRKHHPSLILWEELPGEERDKNRAFIRDLPRILAKTGFQVQRNQ